MSKHGSTSSLEQTFPRVIPRNSGVLTNPDKFRKYSKNLGLIANRIDICTLPLLQSSDKKLMVLAYGMRLAISKYMGDVAALADDEPGLEAAMLEIDINRAQIEKIRSGQEPYNPASPEPQPPSPGAEPIYHDFDPTDPGSPPGSPHFEPAAQPAICLDE